MQSNDEAISDSQKLTALRQIKFLFDESGNPPLARSCGITEQVFVTLANEEYIEVTFFEDDGPTLDRYHIQRILPKGFAMLAQARVANEPLPVITEQPLAPTVFISYSHDTKEHKAWVGSLAQRLRQAGINVLFDQWDLGPGDDVPKFMEQAVAKADRVLMICSEAYVRKADDGKGGVGYEAMIVTGELVRDLALNKFIPIIRQTNTPVALPRCVSTRFYVDLSNEANAEEAIESLLREIHDAPKLPKPPLGKNPFSIERFDSAKTIAAKESRRMEFSDVFVKPEATYQEALEIIKGNDRVAWRKMLLAASETGGKALLAWRAANPQIPPVTNTAPNNPEWSVRFAHVQSGVECFAPLIACLVAAAETGKEGYADQLGWIEAILQPVGFDKNGAIYYISFPQTILFVAQALVGGMLMLSGTGEAAYRLANTKVADWEGGREARPLFAMNRCNGWPDTLEHHCSIGWIFLNSLIDSWTWLKTAFGNERECRVGVSSYYQMLSFLNFIKLTKTGKINVDQGLIEPFQITVPLCYCSEAREIVEKGYKLFLNQRHLLKRVLEVNELDDAVFEAAWAKWMQKVHEWLASVYMMRGPYLTVAQNRLPKDIKGDPIGVIE